MANNNNSSSSAMMTPVEPLESRDEVDFIMTAAAHNNNNDYEDFSSASVAVISAKAAAAAVDKPEAATVTTTTTTTATVTPNIEPNSNQNSLKKSKERRTLFGFGSKKSSSNSSSKSQVEAGSAPVASSGGSSLLLPPTPPVPIGTPPRQHKFVKSNSIARLLGNTYNARKFEREEQKRLANEASGKFHTFSGRRRGSGPYLERFKRMSKEDGDIAGGGAGVDENAVQVTNVMTLTTDSRDLQYGSRQEHVGRAEDQLSAKAMRTLTRSLGKLWWKRTHSVDISTPDPEYKVSYLGNVLTGWAKGEST